MYLLQVKEGCDKVLVDEETVSDIVLQIHQMV
jgi:hypothetical protein